MTASHAYVNQFERPSTHWQYVDGGDYSGLHMAGNSQAEFYVPCVMDPTMLLGPGMLAATWSNETQGVANGARQGRAAPEVWSATLGAGTPAPGCSNTHADAEGRG